MMGCPDCGRDDSHWAEISALKARIADLEKQLAEEHSNRAGVERLRASHYELERMLAEQTKCTKTAEKRVEELQALVDAARVGLTDITGAAERMLRIVDSYTFRTAEEAAIGTPARLLVDLLPEMRRLARELATKEPR